MWEEFERSTASGPASSSTDWKMRRLIDRSSDAASMTRSTPASRP